MKLSLLKKTEEKLCFFINCFNALVVYSLYRTSINAPCTLYNWKKYIKCAHAEIGGYKLSLLDIMCIIYNEEKVNDMISPFMKKEINNKKLENIFSIPKIPLINMCLTIPSE